MVKSSKLKSVYDKSTVDDQRRIYKDWAETYDADTTKELGWIAFKPAAEELAARIPDKAARILDAGCGTGLSGVALSAIGYQNIEGCDLSLEMLAKAKKKAVYKSLSEVDMTKPIIGLGSFDAVFSCGVFGFGPPHTEHICNLTELLKPRGYAFITVNGKGWIDRKWSEKLPEIVTEHNLVLEDTMDIKYLESEDFGGKLLVFRG